MTTTSNSSIDTFAEEYPKFRLLTLIYIVYWIILLALLFSRDDLEFGDTFSFLLYSAFGLTHLFVLVATYISDWLKKGQKLIFYVAIFPSVLSTIAILISIFSYGSTLLEIIFS